MLQSVALFIVAVTRSMLCPPIMVLSHTAFIWQFQMSHTVAFSVVYATVHVTVNVLACLPATSPAHNCLHCCLRCHLLVFFIATLSPTSSVITTVFVLHCQVSPALHGNKSTFCPFSPLLSHIVTLSIIIATVVDHINVVCVSALSHYHYRRRRSLHRCPCCFRRCMLQCHHRLYPALLSFICISTTIDTHFVYSFYFALSHVTNLSLQVDTCWHLYRVTLHSFW